MIYYSNYALLKCLTTDAASGWIDICWSLFSERRIGLDFTQTVQLYTCNCMCITTDEVIALIITKIPALFTGSHMEHERQK